MIFETMHRQVKNKRTAELRESFGSAVLERCSNNRLARTAVIDVLYADLTATTEGCLIIVAIVP
jgi:hypothetical protein